MIVLHFLMKISHNSYGLKSWPSRILMPLLKQFDCKNGYYYGWADISTGLSWLCLLTNSTEISPAKHNKTQFTLKQIYLRTG